jgi:hypothetical protein
MSLKPHKIPERPTQKPPETQESSISSFSSIHQSVLFWEFIEERILTEDIFASDTDSDSSDFTNFF